MTGAFSYLVIKSSHEKLASGRPWIIWPFDGDEKSLMTSAPGQLVEVHLRRCLTHRVSSVSANLLVSRL
jgi:hypothetical protein